ncbi:MAG TPA: fumarylacetoacetase [Fimbriimonas sp.]|nr:fumarylacetoacetase [Fimbriimonas sp.]
MTIIPPSAKSYVTVEPDSHFPIQNLPFGMAKIGGWQEPVLVSRIGDRVILIPAVVPEAPLSLATATRAELSAIRKTLAEKLDIGVSSLPANCFLDADQVEMLLPIKPTAFIDFYSGINHASNVGTMFRPDQPPLLPNYRHLPVGYNGRASSVVVSGTPIPRPSGQTKGANDELPTFGPTTELDFELEMGFYVDQSSALGEVVPIDQVQDRMLGFVLVNDWSARDVQRWEYQPLGPFLAKSFATSISPWVVLADALEPFRTTPIPQDPPPLPHLAAYKPMVYDIVLEVQLNGHNICHSNAKHLYWSFDQQLAHQSSNGTPLEANDLYASGTISGSEPGSFGSMLELTWRGTKPLELGDETRKFLENGDTLTMVGYAQGDGYRVGFGEVTGTIVG